MKQYLDLLRKIKEEGVLKSPARKGMPSTREINGYMMKFDIQKGFPLLTTKKMFFNGIKAELIWFIKGDTNVKSLWDMADCHIWDADAFKYYKRIFPLSDISIETWKEKVNKGEIIMDAIYNEIDDIYEDYVFGDCGRIYGEQWRNWENWFDQFSNLINSIKQNPDSRYHIVTGWNPSDFIKQDTMAALPACHMMFQCFVREGYLDMVMYQRSCDTFLGVPFNIASYALLDILIAKECGYKPGVLTWVGGSVHYYENHIDAINEQLTRNPLTLPNVTIKDDENWSIFDVKMDDIVLENYECHPRIKAELSVGV